MPRSTCISLLFILFIAGSVESQHSLLLFDASQLCVFHSSKEHNQGRQSFSRRMYNQLKPYIVYKNAHYKGLHFQIENKLNNKDCNDLDNGNGLMEKVRVGFGVFDYCYNNPRDRKTTGMFLQKPLYVELDFLLKNFLQLKVGTTIMERHVFTHYFHSRTYILNPQLEMTARFGLNRGKLRILQVNRTLEKDKENTFLKSNVLLHK